MHVGHGGWGATRGPIMRSAVCPRLFAILGKDGGPTGAVWLPSAATMWHALQNFCASARPLSADGRLNSSAIEDVESVPDTSRKERMERQAIACLLFSFVGMAPFGSRQFTCASHSRNWHNFAQVQSCAISARAVPLLNSIGTL